MRAAREADAALAPARKRWGLTADGAACATASSVLQPVRSAGRPAYLKLATVPEEAAGARVLRWWAGRGAADVLAACDDTLLLERAVGDGDLSALARSGVEGDDEATRILCRVASALHRVDDRPRPEGIVDLRSWFRELFEHADAHPLTHAGLFPRAATMAESLLTSPLGDVVLHGDVHHGNVLDFGERGWLAIDPKSLHGDPAFDFANILCNPDLATATRPGRMDRTLRVIAEETGVEEERMLRWTLAWAGLSAAWSEGSGDDAGVAVAVGMRAAALLG